MANNRHLYAQDVLDRYVPSRPEYVEQQRTSDDADANRNLPAELESSADPQSEQASAQHEVHAESSTMARNHHRKDSGKSLTDSTSTTQAVIEEYNASPSTVPVDLPPLYPARAHGFDPGELEEAINDAFG